MPKVSVIVPIYGVEKYIERCARSLFEQSLNDIEYIFVNDCTTDRSVCILKQLLCEYPNRLEQTIIVDMPVNSGLAAVRKYGLSFATGDYIIHCDSDDWVDKAMYRSMYEDAIANDADVVICDYYVADGLGNNNPISTYSITSKEKVMEDLIFMRSSWAVWNKMFKRSFYMEGQFVYPTGAMGEDMCICLQLMWNCSRISYIAKPYYYYYFNPDSITKKMTEGSCLRKFYQLKDNTDIILGFFETRILTTTMRDGLLMLKFRVKNQLLPLLGDRKYIKLWRETYNDMFFQFMVAKNISPKIKLKYFLIVLLSKII